MKLLRVLRRINLATEPTLRHIWVYLRASYLVRVRKKLRTLESPHAFDATLKHNLRSLFGANNRMNMLLFPLSVIETLNADSKILVIGPRNENDLFSLVGLGFKMKNIRGLDLISYSPHIQLGDMHAIPFPDGSFDAVVCGWTLSYSATPEKAAQEITRVCKPGGIIAIAVEYSTMTADDERALVGYAVEDTKRRINSTADIRALFEPIGTVYFEHDAPNKVSHTRHGLVSNVSNVALVFSRTS
jgi:SAM-dependent methyltransferase